MNPNFAAIILSFMASYTFLKERESGVLLATAAMYVFKKGNISIAVWMTAEFSTIALPKSARERRMISWQKCNQNALMGDSI